MTEQSDAGVERCPECGSLTSEKGVSIDGRKTSLESSWRSCLNCGWDDK